MQDITVEMILETIRKELNELEEKYRQSKSPKREWEIVAFRCEGRVFRLRENYKEYGYELPAFTDGDSILGIAYGLEPKNNCTIHSVRRLSDGEVFSVGDRILSGTIINIETTDKSCDGLVLRTGEWTTPISCAEKLPAPLFTTTDGKEIYPDRKEPLSLVYNDLGFDFNVSVDRALLEKKRDESVNIFSTREAAEEYILNNKPLLSLNDVRQAAGNANTSAKVLNELTALVKQKLNQ